MNERRFSELREELLQAGISRRNVRRAVREVEDHFHDLVAAAMARGADRRNAHAEAHALVGANRMLVERYAARPELRAWANRWPAIWFTLVPIGSYLAVCAATMALLFAALSQMSGHLHQIQVAPRVTDGIDLAVRLLFLGVLPATIAAVFGVLAYRRRIPVRWPVIGIFLLSALASLINVDLTITGGASPGQAGAGIGASLSSLFLQSMRTLAVAGAAFTLQWIGTRRYRRNRAALP